MITYRKKPVVIEAIQWDGSCMDAFNVWLDPPDGGSAGLPFTAVDPASTRCLEIATLEGRMVANAGDWIIKGVKGEFYPCKPDIFAATYEPVVVPPPPALWGIEYEKLTDGVWKRDTAQYDSEFIARQMANDIERAPGHRVIKFVPPASLRSP